MKKLKFENSLNFLSRMLNFIIIEYTINYYKTNMMNI